MLKVNQLLSALFAILIMSAMFFVSLSIPFSDQAALVSIRRQGVRPATPMETLFGTLLFVLCIILAGEAVRVWVRQSLTLDENKLVRSSGTIWSQIGKASLAKNLIFTPLFLLLLVVMNIVFLYFLTTNIAAHRDALPPMFFVIVGIYVIYFLIRRPLAKGLRALTGADKRQGGILGRSIPSFALKGDAVVLDLKRKRALPPGQRPFIGVANQPSLVTIRFDELDEVRALTYVEAQAYMQYQVGPDLQMALSSTRDLYRYLNGEIERPSVYGHWGSIGTVLILQGPQLFYAISVTNTNVDDLLAAFERSKGQRAVPSPLAAT